MSSSGTVAVLPIRASDLAEVGRFLHDHLDPRLSPRAWADAATPPWSAEQPNHGFLLRDDDAGITGVHLAFYSERRIDGRAEPFCNLAAWCVLESHRAHGIKLLRALLRQPGYHFTDLSPSGNVVELNRRLRFQELDTTTWVVPNLPWPLRARDARVLERPAQIEEALDGAALALYLDHRDATAVRHLVIAQDDGQSCLVVVRRERRKRLPLFASIVHLSDPGVFARHHGLVLGRLLLRHGVVATLAERHVTGRLRRRGRRVSRPQPRMFKSRTLRPGDVDYLYSELTCVAW